MLFFDFSGKRGIRSGAVIWGHVLLCILVFMSVFSKIISAKPIQQNQAEKAARGWLKENRHPMDRLISQAPVACDPISDETGLKLCFIVNLNPEGFVILSTDDEINPVIAFSSTGHVDSGEDNPLRILLKKDMRNRLEAVRQKPEIPSRRDQKMHRWKRLIEVQEQAETAVSDIVQAAAPTSLSDVRVDPFVTTQWGQTNAAGDWCYNYYTPSHYPCGCVATAMAQLMYYHRWPTSGIGGGYLGGDGTGGPYDWTQMPEIPSNGLTTAQRELIGRLCRDVGLSVDMDYSPGVSIANLYDTDKVLLSTFMYANSIYTENVSASGSDLLWIMMNSNMDAQLPVLLAISRAEGAHAIIADGYGYNDGVPYHHLNMGWDGLDNAWYQLPDIDTSLRDYTAIDLCMYNIYPQGTGEIISGRVTDLSGVPLSGAVVTAWQVETMVQQTTTNHRGVYAFVHMASNTLYDISVQMDGWFFTDRTGATGRSKDGAAVSGNCWGVDFTGYVSPSEFGPPIALNAVADVNSWHMTPITLTAVDEDPYDPNNPSDPNFYHYIITSLPLHCDLSEPNVGLIESVPYVLIHDVNQVVTCTPCPYFSGQDSFTFKVNDGGVYPTGGESNIAMVVLNVNNQVQSGFGTEPNECTTLMMDCESFYDVRSQVIYLQKEIGHARAITEMALHVAAPPGQTLRNWTIRMQHTHQTYFDDVNDLPSQFLTDGWTTVYHHDMPSQSGWMTFPLDTPFDYNGKENLLVDFSFNNSVRGGSAGSYYMQPVACGRVLTLASPAGINGDPLTWDFWAIGGTYYLDRFVPSLMVSGPISERLAGDFDDTCDVTLPDMARFAKAWQTSPGDVNYDPVCDLSVVKGVIDLEDLDIMSEQWLHAYSEH